ncbi:hypothetical protein FB567DRAFT_69456 [Paraphoma chrysanthemicola]|uniref:SP-RING-type domain-containing protein n=1 Tax=Paraphoma chrysanthemicola TaxID=798071 RepID=A0A8K0R3S4_9PLEO|nr:hypothetical protein FB567DRAFT_69456 [Paraphoma chrysanthemicola]
MTAGAGREPAKDATAQTLNLALGNLGGRQKSWLQTPNTAPSPLPSDLTRGPALPFVVRRRGRPPKAAAPPVAEERQPPSNSTSPQLANVVTRRDTVDRRPSSVTVFPSPTPSEETMEAAASPALRQGITAADGPVLGLHRSQTSYAPETHLDAVSMDAVQRGASGPKRSPEEGTGQAAKRNRSHEAAQSSMPVPPHPDFARWPSIAQAHTGSPHLEHTQTRRPSLVHAPNGHMASPQLAQNPQPRPVVRTPPVAPTPFESAQTPSVESNWYSVAECLQALQAFQATFAVAPDARDGRRISVLRDAAQTEDWQYLIMHQYYCLMDYNPSLLPADLRNKPGLNQALYVMQKVLDYNKHLSPAVLHFFANFPYPLHELHMRWISTLEQQTRIFLSFVAYSSNFDHLRITCERRRFPPVAWELAHYLSLNSTTFQRLLFTAILRGIWLGVPQTPLISQYETRAVGLFTSSQASYYRRIAPGPDGRHPTTQKLQQDNELDLRNWGPQLRQVVESLEATLRQQGHAISTSYDNNLPHAQQHAPPQQYTPQNSTDMSSRAYRPQPRSAQAAIQQTRGPGRPRTHPLPPTHTLPSTPPVQQTAQLRQHRARTHLLPAPGFGLSQQRLPNPARFSLHQANLRSPVLQARSLGSPLYCYVQGYIKSPARLTNANQAVVRWTFTPDENVADNIAPAIEAVPGHPDRRLMDPNSKTVRLRCIKWPAAQPPDTHVWAVTDTSWIPYSYFTLNGKSLHQRKKIHNGKDLPIDITGLLNRGENVLEMTVMTEKKDTSYQNYLVAIEMLGVASRDTLRQRCLTESRLSPEQVVEAIRRKLGGGIDDDEVAIVESNLTINLFDPFSASKICDIPVRSKACLHNDCFDLDTFLDTRGRKGDVSVPDSWRCPICNADARPNHLIVDGFLQEVKEQLDAQNMSKTRAIIVQQDGAWSVKPEVRDPNGVSDRGVSDDPPTPNMARALLPAPVEVIDLSD